MKPKQIVILVIVVLLLIILFQNLDPTEIQILLWNFQITLLLIILLPFLLGMVVGWLIKAGMVKRKKEASQKE